MVRGQHDRWAVPLPGLPRSARAENYLKDNKIDVKNEESQTVIDVAALQKDGNVPKDFVKAHGKVSLHLL